MESIPGPYCVTCNPALLCNCPQRPPTNSQLTKEQTPPQPSLHARSSNFFFPCLPVLINSQLLQERACPSPLLCFVHGSPVSHSTSHGVRPAHLPKPLPLSMPDPQRTHSFSLKRSPGCSLPSDTCLASSVLPHELLPCVSSVPPAVCQYLISLPVYIQHTQNRPTVGGAG